MALLTLTLLGPPLITGADGTALAFRSRKALALLVYLAIEQGTEHSRDSLVGLLWPEDSEEAARNSLRVALANLRQTLGEPAGRLLRASRTGVQLARDSDHALDVATFSTLLAACSQDLHCWSRGSSASRRPSPIRLMESTARKMARPGTPAIHHASRRNGVPASGKKRNSTVSMLYGPGCANAGPHAKSGLRSKITASPVRHSLKRYGPTLSGRRP